MKEKEYYNGVYSTSDKYKAHYSKSKYLPMWEKLLKWLQKNNVETVLDIGCGTAQLGAMLSDNDIDYRGFDYSKTAIDLEKACGLCVWVGDITDTNNYYKADAYVCTEVLEHVYDDKEVFAKLPKGSLFCFSVPTFKHEAHVRRFKTEESIRERYSDVCGELKIKSIGKRFLCKGVVL